MFPNPNDWLLINTLDEQRSRKAQEKRRSRMVVRRWSLERLATANLANWIREQIIDIGRRLQPVEKPGCTFPCPVGCCEVAAV